jgi:hypothetical protein
MMVRRSSGLIPAQRATSSIVRPQPRHKPEAPSISQTSMQGVSKGGFGSAVNRSYVGGELAPDNCLFGVGLAPGAGSKRA